ncbi:MAG: hypothetical protein DIJKHBIC_02080 [Thermoanaerobaculia bacterium]|nr:hypothetical protein [Thermoanaerobaculia bacterium]
MAKKREGVASTPAESPVDMAAAGEGSAAASPSPRNTENKDEEIGFTGLALSEQRSNLIKVAIFLIGSALLIFGLKQYFGW